MEINSSTSSSDDDNDNGSLSIRYISNSESKSYVWKHFGALTKNGKIIDEKKNYCKHCLEKKSMKR